MYLGRTALDTAVYQQDKALYQQDKALYQQERAYIGRTVVSGYMRGK